MIPADYLNFKNRGLWYKIKFILLFAPSVLQCYSFAKQHWVLGMYSESRKATLTFISGLAGAKPDEIQEYLVEIESDRTFRRSLEEKRNSFDRGHYFSWGIGESLGKVLYAVYRRKKPDVIVETGVASGESSSYILCALEKNDRGELYSIDLPWWDEEQSGWLIPDYLKHRWHLTLGRSSKKLTPLLKELGGIDIFLHDSDHSYENMLWEYQTAWAYLKDRGLLLSHNIDANSAFGDFCRSVKAEGYLLGNMGVVIKTRQQVRRV